LGITIIRITFGLDHHFDQALAKSSLFTLTSSVIALQIIFGILGYKVMKTLGYFEEYVDGDKKSAISFSLICPGVAFVVFGMFFVHFGLVANGIIQINSIAYLLFLLPFMFVQYRTVKYYGKLKRKFEL
jgi:hypothetical protein